MNQTPATNKTFIEKTVKFNELGGNPIGYDRHMLPFYIGMVLEESAEMIAAFENGRGETDIVELHELMQRIGTKFKNGDYDALSDNCDIIEVLDGAVDTAVVSIGTIMKTGFDPAFACHQVADSNLSKFVIGEDGKLVALKNEQGKIMKGPNYFRPDFSNALFWGEIHPSLNETVRLAAIRKSAPNNG